MAVGPALACPARPGKLGAPEALSSPPRAGQQATAGPRHVRGGRPDLIRRGYFPRPAARTDGRQRAGGIGRLGRLGKWIGSLRAAWSLSPALPDKIVATHASS
ncbi:hypothetical protein BS78_02G175600 [Paspalum vaginatum]|nr:hypothetical protein BS78_02G175600 [Paspalum vaginatum]